jgi:hypothetical protein
MSMSLRGEGGIKMLTLVSFIVFCWSVWFWYGLPQLEWLIPGFAALGVVSSVWAESYSRFEARRKRLK